MRICCYNVFILLFMCIFFDIKAVLRTRKSNIEIKFFLCPDMSKSIGGYPLGRGRVLCINLYFKCQKLIGKFSEAKKIIICKFLTFIYDL